MTIYIAVGGLFILGLLAIAQAVKNNNLTKQSTRHYKNAQDYRETVDTYRKELAEHGPFVSALRRNDKSVDDDVADYQRVLVRVRAQDEEIRELRDAHESSYTLAEARGSKLGLIAETLDEAGVDGGEVTDRIESVLEVWAGDANDAAMFRDLVIRIREVIPGHVLVQKPTLAPPPSLDEQFAGAGVGLASKLAE